MKKKILAVTLGLVSAGFCVNEYMPVEKGKLEIDGGYSFAKITGFYDEDGEKQDLANGVDPTLHGLPLQLKYGIFPGLDVELAWTGIIGNEAAGDLGGFAQPEIALKYGMADIGAGAFVNLTLPFVTGNLDTPDDPAMGVSLGAVYGNRFGDFRATGMAAYKLNFENKDKFKDGNVLTVYLKPEAMWTEFIGTYLGLRYEMFGESESAGNGAKDDGYLLSVAPGLNAQLLPNLAYEVNIPITVMGKSNSPIINPNPSSWSIWASVYYTLGL